MTSDFFTRLAGRALGKISVVQPDIVPIFTVTPSHESKKIPSGYQEGLLDVAEDNGISSSFLSTRPGVNMTDVTSPEPSDINHAVQTPTTGIVNKTITQVDDTVVSNELCSVERCTVQGEITASTIGSDSTKATSKTRSTNNFYSLSTSENAESLDSKIPTISKSSLPNIMNEKNRYKLPEEELRKRADARIEGIPVSMRSTGIMANNDTLHEDTGSFHTVSYSKGENFTGEQSPPISSLVADTARVQEKDKKLVLNFTDISEIKTIESSKNSNKLLKDNGRHEARGSHASENSFKENKKNNIPHLAVYSADAENKKNTSPLVGEATVDMHVAARPLDDEKVYSLHENISENLEDWPIEIAYSIGAQSKETISSLDDNSIDGIRKLAQSPIPQEQLIHVSIGRIYVKASLPQGHNEERHKIVKQDPPLSLDEYLKRRSGGSYE